MSSKAFLLAIPTLAVFSLFTSESVTRIIRRLAVDCVENVYATPSSVITIPEVPEPNTTHVPAYLALCQVSNSDSCLALQFHPLLRVPPLRLSCFVLLTLPF
jgi:hypothetical protein